MILEVIKKFDGIFQFSKVDSIYKVYNDNMEKNI